MGAMRDITRELTVVCGFSKHKVVDPMLQFLSNPDTEPKIRAVHPVSCEHFRLQDSAKLYEQMQTHTSDIWKEPQSITDTLKSVVEDTKEGDVILIFGSFFIMAEVRDALGIDQVVDPPMINK